MTDTEKITVNLNVVDLGKIDLLVDEGFYTNRADFLRTALGYPGEEWPEIIATRDLLRELTPGGLRPAAAPARPTAPRPRLPRTGKKSCPVAPTRSCPPSNRKSR